MDIKKLIFTGVVTNYCVETAVRDAGDRDYNVILVDDGCAAFTPEQHRFALEILDDCYCQVMTTEEVIALVEAVTEAHTRTLWVPKSCNSRKHETSVVSSHATRRS